jgi:hypothetical protein
MHPLFIPDGNIGYIELIVQQRLLRKQKKSLKNSEKHIGDYKLEWENE